MNAIRRILGRTTNTARTYSALITRKMNCREGIYPSESSRVGSQNFLPYQSTPFDPSPKFEFYDLEPSQESFREHVINGLSKPQKAISCKFLYDKRGSKLFDDICHVPEYYQTRTEISILENNAHEIAQLMGKKVQLIELGSGASHKIRVLLSLLKDSGVHYVPIDISREFLRNCAQKLALSHPNLKVSAICADYTSMFELPSSFCSGHEKRAAFFPGSTIGNLTPVEAFALLKEWNRILGERGDFLVGVDLKKDSKILNAAYNDQQGISEEFNLNLLHRINHELGADFDHSKFVHEAFYNEHEGRIEIYITSIANQMVTIGQNKFKFRVGERIHTEYSYKYTVDEFYLLARMSGFTPVKTWVDENKLFSVHYLRSL